MLTYHLICQDMSDHKLTKTFLYLCNNFTGKISTDSIIGLHISERESLKATGYRKLVMKLEEKFPSYSNPYVFCYFNDIHVSLSTEPKS